MKRTALPHERVFTNQDAADRYVQRHLKMVRELGQDYAGKLAARGFEGGKILDVGCGFGGVMIVLASAFPEAEVWGIDLSTPLLNQAQEMADVDESKNRLRFERANVESIPHDADTFDVVINTNMVHIVEHPIEMLNEMERVLKPDGLLFIADIRRSWIGLFEPPFKSALTLEEAKALLGQSGLRAGTFFSSFLWWRYET